MHNLLAQTRIGNFEGIGPLGNLVQTYGPAAFVFAMLRFADVISKVIGLMTIMAGIWFTFQLFMSGISWISAGGEKQAIENAKKRFTNALIGITIVVAAYSLISLVGMFLGINFLNLAPLLILIRP